MDPSFCLFVFAYIIFFLHFFSHFLMRLMRRWLSLLSTCTVLERLGCFGDVIVKNRVRIWISDYAGTSVLLPLQITLLVGFHIVAQAHIISPTCIPTLTRYLYTFRSPFTGYRPAEHMQTQSKSYSSDDFPSTYWYLYHMQANQTRHSPFSKHMLKRCEKSNFSRVCPFPTQKSPPSINQQKISIKSLMTVSRTTYSIANWMPYVIRIPKARVALENRKA